MAESRLLHRDAGLHQALLQFGSQRIGDLLDVAAQGDLIVSLLVARLAVIVGIGTCQVTQRRLALGGHVRGEVVDIEDGLRRVFHVPDHHGRYLDRVAALVVDLQPLHVEGAGSQADLVAVLAAGALLAAVLGGLLAGVAGRLGGLRGAVGEERVGPVEAGGAGGAFVRSEEDQHPRLVGLQGKEARHEQDAGQDHDDADDHQGGYGVVRRLKSSRAEDGQRDAAQQEGERNRQHEPAVGDVPLLFDSHGRCLRMLVGPAPEFR